MAGAGFGIMEEQFDVVCRRNRKRKRKRKMGEWKIR
jgi:hypothetical protein